MEDNRSLMIAGHTLMGIGLVLRTIGASSGDALVFLAAFPVGYLAKRISLPLLGFGAGRAGAAAKSLDPGYEDGSSGWGVHAAHRSNLSRAQYRYLREQSKTGWRLEPTLAPGAAGGPAPGLRLGFRF